MYQNYDDSEIFNVQHFKHFFYNKIQFIIVLYFSWILKLVRKGLKKELDVIDLYTILDEDSSALLGSKLKT